MAAVVEVEVVEEAAEVVARQAEAAAAQEASRPDRMLAAWQRVEAAVAERHAESLASRAAAGRATAGVAVVGRGREMAAAAMVVAEAWCLAVGRRRSSIHHDTHQACTLRA